MGNSESGARRHGSEEARRVAITDFILPVDDFVHIIGEGSFSKVSCLQKKGTNKLLAMKSMPKERLIQHKELGNVYNELCLLRNLPHSHFVVNLYYAFQDKNNVYMGTNIMLGGSLSYNLKRIMRTRRQQPSAKQYIAFSPPIVKHLVVQLVLALQFLHSHRIVHRDIKPDNLLLNHHGHLRIADLNVSISFKDESEELVAKHNDGWGTMGFRAPEIYLRKGKGMLYACDWWSTGAVTYLISCGELPYIKKHSKERNVALVKRMRTETFATAQLEVIDPNCLKLCKQLLRYSPSERIGCQFGSQSEVIILTHEYFENVDWDLYESGEILKTKVNIFSDKTILTQQGRSEVKSQSSTSTISHRKPRESDLEFSAEIVLRDFNKNFDKSLDLKAVNNHIQNQFSGSKSSSSLEEKLVPAVKGKSKPSSRQQQMLALFYFNYEQKYKEYFKKRENGINISVNGDDEYSTLQFVSSMKPSELKEYILNSDEAKLETLCREMKEFREDYLVENQQHMKARVEVAELRKEVRQLRTRPNREDNVEKPDIPVIDFKQKSETLDSQSSAIITEEVVPQPESKKSVEMRVSDSSSQWREGPSNVDLSIYEDIENCRVKSDSEHLSDSDESEIEFVYRPS